MICNSCSSKDVILDVKVGIEGWGTNIKLEIFKYPQARVFKGLHEAVIKGAVCVSCGNVMMYVDQEFVETIKKFKKISEDNSEDR